VRVPAVGVLTICVKGASSEYVGGRGRNVGKITNRTKTAGHRGGNSVSRAFKNPAHGTRMGLMCQTQGDCCLSTQGNRPGDRAAEKARARPHPDYNTIGGRGGLIRVGRTDNPEKRDVD